MKVGLDYSVRWKVERIFTWVGNFRRLLVRHERYLSTFRAFFLVALIRISMRHFKKVPYEGNFSTRSRGLPLTLSRLQRTSTGSHSCLSSRLLI